MYNIEIRKITISLIRVMTMIENGYELNLEKLDMPCDSYRLLIY